MRIKLQLTSSMNGVLLLTPLRYTGLKLLPIQELDWVHCRNRIISHVKGAAHDFIDLGKDPYPVNDNSASCMAQDLQGAGSSFQGTIPGVGRVEGEEELQVVHQVEFVPAMVGLPRGSL